MKTELMRQVMIEQYKSHKIEPYRDYEPDLTFKEWLEMEIDNNPESFDPFFDRPWDELEGEGQEIRAEIIFYTLTERIQL